MSEQSRGPSPEADGGRGALALEVGQTVMEYAIERTLGGGGFGITYLARDLNLSLLVALKEYLPADLAHRTANGTVAALGRSAETEFLWGLERFLDEARALARFNHPNIVRVLRYFQTNGTAYIVMEYQAGYSLKQWLPRHMPLGRRDLLELILPLLDGLELIHQAGFLHRDIKPDNIFVRGDGKPVLLDFGAARRASAGQDLTKIITPGFAPFEQYHSKGNQGPWSDLYSLAAVMYWLVSGEKPIESAARLKHDDMVPATQSDHHHLIGEPILSAIDWAMGLDEEKRPQSAAEFRSRLLGESGFKTRKSTGDDVTISLSKLNRESNQEPPPAPATPPPPTMESQRGNIVCTVLFLDIIAYSRVSVSEQYDLKKSFNALISEKLLRVPESARISLDTGDGAAICFMGDPEDVLHTAIDIRRSLTDHEELNVRMGLHIGPVRILTDLNQRGNVVGDGINVAQRVMSFSDERTLLVSRAFYDVVSCLADRGADGFRYVGDQADKHGRIHQLYEVVVDDGASRIFHSIGESVGLTEVAGEELDERSVTLIEQELTNHLGPLAPVLIRKALKRASTPSQLRELLAPSIADPGLQEAFRLGTDGRHRDPSRTRSAGATRLTDHPPTSHTRSAPGSHTSLAGHSRPSQGSASLPLSNTGPSFRPTLPQEALEPLEKLLAKLVGPLARVLVKNEARKAADFGGLVQALSTHIDNAQARSQFLASATALRKSLRIGESRDSEMSVPSRGPRGTSRLADSTTRRTLSDLDASRFLSTVMFTDICDSTLHASHLGDRRWSEVLAKHHALVRAELSKLGGREMDTAGDGFFAIFDVPARAIRCACAIRDAVQTLGIDIRIGLHTGELETIGEKATGIAVHMGARIAALAEANQVLVSSTVKDLITGSSIRLIDRGTHQLKGIPGMWHLYAVQ